MGNELFTIGEVIMDYNLIELIKSELVSLTELIVKYTNQETGGGLGGEYGYGAKWDSDMFMMHPFCWCDEDHCPWCNGEGEPNFLFKPTGFSISWYKYIGRGMEIHPELTRDEIVEMFTQCRKDVEKKK
jgi:hypothetical protein